MRATTTDMCLPKQRTHIGVPLIDEDREPYRREWVVPPKAAYLPGAQPKSEPMLPWQLRDPTPSPTWASSSVAGGSMDVEDGSSNWSSDITTTTEGSMVTPKKRPVFHPTTTEGPPMPKAGEEIRGSELWLPAATRVAFAHIRSVEFQQVLSEMRD